VLSDVVEGRWIHDSTSDGCVVIAKAPNLCGLRRRPRREGDVDAVRHGIFEAQAAIERRASLQGGVVVAHGGATFIDSLIRENLIDEYRLVIHPVVIGNGTSLFGALREPLRLDLVEARTFPSGTLIHVYRPREVAR
jgi:dihydrofolate reductase